MFDFRLKVFLSVAKRLNFTKAAEELGITQPAVSKHIQEIERFYKIKLFDRAGSKIRLTPAGIIMVEYAEQIFETYRQLSFKFSTLNERAEGNLRIGASTTIANYVLPAIIAAFKKKYPDVGISLMVENTEKIENALEENQLDCAIVEGSTRNKNLKYSEFLEDEIVLTANANHPLAKLDKIDSAQLKKIPLLMRESGSGTLQVIGKALKDAGYKVEDLKIEMQLGSTEGIKNYLSNSNCMAFLSVYSVMKELRDNQLSIIDVYGLSINRYFLFVEQHGNNTDLIKLFNDFAYKYNLK